MKVPGIVGSPRKGGNTEVMVGWILEGAREAGAETEIVRLGELAIRECDGCRACRHGKPCPKADDISFYREHALAQIHPHPCHAGTSLSHRGRRKGITVREAESV
jgi:multimeric flavodoxin WrbA